MSFSTVTTVGFRNLEDAETDTDAGEIFLVGENGQGKTNFLEAVYFCIYASSFRSSHDAEMIRIGKPSCSVIGKVRDSVVSRISSRIEDGKKCIYLDDKRVSDRRQMLDAAQAIVFCHEDLEFVSGTPERRRWFFDQTITLYSAAYLDEFRRYRKILKTRNTLIKDRNASMLDLIDIQFVEAGLELMRHREEAVQAFSPIFGPLYERVAAIDGVSVRYAPSWKERDRDTVVDALQRRRELDFSFGTSLSGPHRDRYQFIRQGTDFVGKASTGQRRLLSLLLRSAQAARFAQVTGKKPILLLDDVLLELDPLKRQRFLENLPAYDQSFFTFLPNEPVEAYRKATSKVFTMKGGCLSHEKSL